MKTITIRKSYHKVELSKQDEIDILETLHKAFENTTHYLAGLFSGHMVNYVSDNIRNDHWPDLMSEMMNNGSKQLGLEYDNRVVREENESLSERIKNLNVEIAVLREKLTESNKRLENAENRLATQSTVIGRFQESLKDLLTV